MALVSVTLFTACSSDDDDAVTPVFPQVQTIAGAAGDVKEFTFDANESWSLSSNKIWCKIAQNDAENGFVINGTAGKQTVKVTLTDDDASKDLSVAQLNLKMGGQEVTIAEVHRSAAGYELKVFDVDGNDITETGIEAGYNEYKKFTVKANYRFAATNMPSWVELEGGFLVGTPNKDAVGGVAFKENQGVSAKYAIANDGTYNITFTSEDGKGVETVPVIFKGMPEDMMEITYPNDERKVSQWNVWNVSLDGKVFTQNGSSLNGGETNDFTFHNFVPFTLKTLNDAYQLVVFEKTKNGLLEDQSGAVKLQGEKGNVKLTIEPLSSGSRTFVVYALPQAKYKELENGNGPDDMLENNYTNVKSDYDKCFLMVVKQKEEKKGDSEVTAPIVTSMGMNVDCALTTNADFKSYAEGFFSYTGKEVFESTVYGGYVAIYPQIDGWDPTAGANVVIYDGTGNSVSDENYELQMDDKGIYVGLNADALTYPIFAGFNDMQGVCQRVVFINNMGFRSKRK